MNKDPKYLYITQFDLCSRTHSILQRAGIETLGQLCENEREQMFKHRNVGNATVAELDRLIEQNGLSWKASIEKIPISKKPIIEADILKVHKKLKDENRKLRKEVEELTDEVLKSNLEKLRNEARIKELEDKLLRLKA